VWGEISSLESVKFFAPGVARPQGSKKAFLNKRTGKPIYVEASPHVKEWRSVIAASAGTVWKDRPLIEGKVCLQLTFCFLRPKNHYGTGKNAKILKPSAPQDHLKAPDLDKLARAVLDALTNVCYRDDNQVVELELFKLWVTDRPGVQVCVWERYEP